MLKGRLIESHDKTLSRLKQAAQHQSAVCVAVKSTKVVNTALIYCHLFKLNLLTNSFFFIHPAELEQHQHSFLELCFWPPNECNRSLIFILLLEEEEELFY